MTIFAKAPKWKKITNNVDLAIYFKKNPTHFNKEAALYFSNEVLHFLVAAVPECGYFLYNHSLDEDMKEKISGELSSFIQSAMVGCR